MHIVIRRAAGNEDDKERVMERIRKEFVPKVSKIKGFVSYDVVDLGGGQVATISAFNDQAGAEESTRMAREWARDRLADLLQTPIEAMGGEVLVHHAMAAPAKKA